MSRMHIFRLRAAARTRRMTATHGEPRRYSAAPKCTARAPPPITSPVIAGVAELTATHGQHRHSCNRDPYQDSVARTYKITRRSAKAAVDQHQSQVDLNGSVRLSEIEALRGGFGFRAERDLLLCRRIGPMPKKPALCAISRHEWPALPRCRCETLPHTRCRHLRHGWSPF